MLSRQIDGGGGSITFEPPSIPFSIRKGNGAKLTVRGKLRIQPHFYGNESSCILIGEGGELQIDGDFTIGNGVRIVVNPRAKLTIGGRDAETDSGITANSSIIVHRRVEIGRDFICAWGVLVTDSDWHQISGQSPQADVIIGDKVWIAHGSSILKGCDIGAGSIIASHSVLSKLRVAPASLVAGAPGRVVRSGVTWSRELAS